MLMRTLALALVLLIWPAMGQAAGAIVSQDGDYALKPVVTGLKSPDYVTGAGDGSGRLFIVEQGGRIISLKHGLKQVFLDIRGLVDSGGEKGLLGLAFDPHFKQNGRFYVDYTSGGLLLSLDSVIAEFRAIGKSLMVVNANDEKLIMRVPQPFTNHNGGQLAFGPDGMLYIGFGDGGLAYDPLGAGQSLKIVLGKILRIDVHHQQYGHAYAIPTDNPFVADDDARGEIWAYGLRNPWRFSFDAKSGRLYAGDVGQDSREEIDLIQRGGNYGWKVMEGDICTPRIQVECNPKAYAPPILAYGRKQGQAVVGGYVYRGRAVPSLDGQYIFGDYGSGRIWAVRLDRDGKAAGRRLLFNTGMHISSFGVDDNQALYVVDIAGTVYRLASGR
jgi:glucose/arabinose dehydrogenase